MLIEDVLGCRWTVSVLRTVSKGINRPGAMEREIKGISPKILSDRLRRFTNAGLFLRKVFPEVPLRVEYYLTPVGKKFMVVLEAIEKLQCELDRDNAKKKISSKKNAGAKRSQ